MADQDLKFLDVAKAGGPKHQPFEYDAQIKGAGLLAKPGSSHDPVSSPQHYTQTKISAIEVIDDWQLNFELGSVIKYISRFPFKGGLEDLKKAQWYLAREIHNQEMQQSGSTDKPEGN